MSRISSLRLLTIVLIGGSLCALVYFAPGYFMPREEKTPPGVRLKTGGTSVVYVIMENKWKNLYRKEKQVTVDYASTGTTKGLQKLMDKEFAIAFTHAPVSESRRKEAEAKGGEILHIPVVLCGVVPVYNLKELKGKPPLKFTGPVLGDIFLGKIVKWNDPALKKLNPEVELPDTKITVVHRKDSSGTTLLFTDYLDGASSAWHKQIGPAKSKIDWPVGESEARNEGVAAIVRATEGAVGYVDLMVAVGNHLDYGAVENKDRTAFLRASPESITAALKSMLADVPEDLTFKLTNRPGKDSYPICGVIYAVCYQNQPPADCQKVTDFLHWATHAGQQHATDLTYAPLPEELIARVDDRLKRIKAAQ
jgi:phosphate transport system substrate-binding protein